MKIGSIELASPFVLAPMAGVTDSIVRAVARRHGCALVTTEMVSAHLLVARDAPGCLKRMRFEPDERPVSVQLFGSDATMMAEAARRVEDAGADIVDVNLGCSVPKIVKSGGGAILCRDPVQVGRILEQMVAAVRIPVTVKIRKGWDDRSLSALPILHVVEEAGVAALAIHGRTSHQRYGGVADWDFIRELKAAARIPIMGNGDVTTAADALRMLAETGCDACMIGRASRGNPWIFRECLQLWETGQPAAPPSPPERLAIIREHMRRMAERDGAQVAAVRLRSHLGWYVRGLPGSAAFRDRIVRQVDLEIMDAMLTAFFQAAPREAEPVDAAGAFDRPGAET